MNRYDFIQAEIDFNQKIDYRKRLSILSTVLDAEESVRLSLKSVSHQILNTDSTGKVWTSGFLSQNGVSSTHSWLPVSQPVIFCNNLI